MRTQGPWNIAILVSTVALSLPGHARATVRAAQAVVRSVTPSTIGQTAVDPVIEEPIRPLQPGRAGPSPEEFVFPAGTELPSAAAARCGATGPLTPALLVLSLAALRWRSRRD